MENLNQREQEVVLQVMKLICAEEQYLEDWEFSIRMSITRDELRRVIESWPNWKDDEDAENARVTFLAINNSLNEALNGVDISDEVWSQWIGEPRMEVERIFQTWRNTVNKIARD
jgi:hypothetical protein